MQLRCKVCNAILGVSCPDEADEDLRTQSIRREFRVEHVICGEHTVVFEMPNGFNGILETDGPLDWAMKIDYPDDVTPQMDGTFTRNIIRDGVSRSVNVCEDCWCTIPRYIDYPFGLVSPESDGDIDGNGAKTVRMAMDTSVPSVGIKHLPKIVCVGCWLLAFRRMHNHSALPKMSTDVIGDGAPIEAPTPPPEEYAQDPLRQMTI